MALKGIAEMIIPTISPKGKPVIERIRRISRPGLRIYKSVSDLHPIPGFGIQILSTSKGVMTHAAAKKANIGGEVICEVA